MFASAFPYFEADAELGVTTVLLLIAQIYSDLDLEYFERALDWVLVREEVCGDNGAGLQGISQVELSKCILV